MKRYRRMSSTIGGAMTWRNGNKSSRGAVSKSAQFDTEACTVDPGLLRDEFC